MVRWRRVKGARDPNDVGRKRVLVQRCTIVVKRHRAMRLSIRRQRAKAARDRVSNN